MTTEELEVKHRIVEWHSTSVATELHTQISIEFAIACLSELFVGKTGYFTIRRDEIEDKINELKQSLKQD
jgi:hypothetical protein